MSQTINQFKYGTTAQWESSGAILMAGEIGLDTTLRRFKVGDGSTSWAGLEFYGMEDVPLVPGGMIVGSATGEPQCLRPADNRRVLTLVEGVPSWEDVAISLGNLIKNSGDVVVGNEVGAPAVLGAGGASVGDVITLIAEGVVGWDTPSGGEAPANMVTTDTEQEVTAAKTFAEGIFFGPGVAAAGTDGWAGEVSDVSAGASVDWTALVHAAPSGLYQIFIGLDMVGDPAGIASFTMRSGTTDAGWCLFQIRGQATRRAYARYGLFYHPSYMAGQDIQFHLTMSGMSTADYLVKAELVCGVPISEHPPE